METKKMQEIASEFVAGAACTVVTNKSADSSMKKGTKNNPNPFLGRVTIRKTFSGFVMGTDYSNSLLNTAKRMGNEDAEVNLKKNWHEPVKDEVLGRWFSTDKKTHTKYYLKLQRNEMQVACKTITEYFLDERPATEQEVYLIKSWLKAKSSGTSSTQTEMVIDEEHKQHFILPSLDSVVAIKQGSRTWFKQGFSLTSVMVEQRAYTTSKG